MQIIKVESENLEEKYFELVHNISEDTGFKNKPEGNDIIKNKKMFEYFLNKYKYLDAYLANSNDGNLIIKASIYPDCREEYFKKVSIKKSNQKSGDKILSIYDFFIADACDLLDFDRFALAVLDLMKTQNFGNYAKMMRPNEIITEANNYLKSLKKENMLNFIAFINPIDNESVFKIYNYKKMNGEKIEKRKIINLEKDEMNLLLNFLFPTDIVAIMKYSDCGKQMYEIISEGLRELQDKSNENVSNVIKKMMGDTLRSENMQPYISPERFYQIAMYRTIEYIKEGIIYINENDFPEEDLYNISKLSENLKLHLEKIKDKHSMYLPIMDYNSKDKSNIALPSCNDLLKLYDKTLQEFLDKLVINDEMYAYSFLRIPTIHLVENDFIKYLDKVTNKSDFIYLGYSKSGILSTEKFIELTKKLDKNEKDDLTAKLILHEDKNLSKFIEEGLISEFKVRKLYDNGTISINQIKKILEISADDFGKKYLKFSGIRLAELYKTIYSEDIIKILNYKERYSETDVKNVLDENPALNLELRKKDIVKFKKQLRFEKEMFKEFASSENLNEFVESLGEDLGLSSYIALDLFNKGIITEEQAKEIDSIYFTKFIESKKSGKYLKTLNSKENVSNQNKLLNLFSHKRISIPDIIKYYAKGIITEELYHELENEEFKGNVDSSYLTELAEQLKQSNKFLNYTEIERYIIECKKYADSDDFFKGYDDKILLSKKIDELKLVELGKRGLLTKNALSKILERGDTGILVKLIKDENSIDLETARELFQDSIEDENNPHAKRDLLEQVLRKGGFSNDEIFSILLATYRGMDGLSQEQKDLNNSNLQYFLDKGIITIEIDDGKKNNIVGGSASDKDNQRRFPLFERFDNLFTLDNNTIFNKKGPALVFKTKSLGKIIIETLGTIKDDVLVNDLTNHRTFIIDADVYESYKDDFTTILNGKEIIQYNKLINWFDENKDILEIEECRHSKNWKENVRRKVGAPNNNNVDPNLVINNFKDICI